MAIIGTVLVLLLRLWKYLPVMQDSWYHLAVVRAFLERGVRLDGWWEFAPVGRPHLYAPLFHLIFMGIFRLTHLNLVELGKVYDVVTFPLLLSAGWWTARVWFGPRAALLTLLLLALNIGLLFPNSLIMMPGTYAMILWPFLFMLVMRRSMVGAATILTAMCYFHFAVAGVAVLSLVIFLFFQRTYWRVALAAVIAALVLFSPWLVHLVAHREFLGANPSKISIFVPVFSIVAAGLGCVAIYRSPAKEPLAILSIIIACVVFVFVLRERFWAYGGFMCAILGGYGIVRCLSSKVHWAMSILLASAVTLTPFLKRSDARLGLPIPFQSTPYIMATPLFTLADWQRPARAAQISPAVADDVGALAYWVRQNTKPDEIVLTNDPHLGMRLFVLTGRRSTTGLWNEVMTDELKQQMLEHYRTSAGYIILTPVDQDAGPPERSVFVGAFGRFRVFYRAARVESAATVCDPCTLAGASLRALRGSGRAAPAG